MQKQILFCNKYNCIINNNDEKAIIKILKKDLL